MGNSIELGDILGYSHVYVMGFPSGADDWPKFHWEFGIVWLLLG